MQFDTIALVSSKLDEKLKFDFYELFYIMRVSTKHFMLAQTGGLTGNFGATLRCKPADTTGR